MVNVRQSYRRLLPASILLSIATVTVAALVLGGGVDMVAAAVVIFVLSTGAVGAVLASRLHRHPVGWLLLAASVSFAVGGLLVTYVEEVAFGRLSGWPLPAWVVLLGNWAFGLGLAISATFLLLLFPNGRLPSKRWRPVAWIAGVGLVGVLSGVALSPGAFGGLPIENPYALEASDTVLALIEGGGFYLLMLAVVASMGSLILRYRRSTETERQQIKWVVFSVIVVAVGLVSTTVWEFINGAADFPDDAENLVATATLSLVPVAIGIAILRYRLFDLDRIITRTVSYGVVTALLAGVYAGGIFLLQGLVPSSGELAVAGSTLAVAALFQPLRRRVQALVDRRFNRSRFNASELLDGFAGRLRTKTDVTTLVSDLSALIVNAVQPRTVSLWIRQRAVEPTISGDRRSVADGDRRPEIRRV